MSWGCCKLYRPTVRYDEVFRDYVEQVNKTTILDCNQIFRLALFIAAHSDDFKQIIAEYKKEDVTGLPVPGWEVWEDGYWLNRRYKPNKVDVTSESLDTKEVVVEKGEGGVTKVVVSSLL